MTGDTTSQVLPQYRYNTAVSCLSCLAESFHLDLPFEHVAGLTGEAFRLPLYAGMRPGSWMHSVSWPHAARHWLDMLGIDATISWIDSSSLATESWLERQRLLVTETLARGLPVMYWDNVAWGLIVAEDEDSYLVSGVPEIHLPAELPDGWGLGYRCFGPAGHADSGAFRITREQVRPLFEGDSMFIYPQGRVHADSELLLARALARAARELAGQVNWARQLDSEGSRLEPLFGTAALERMASELRAADFSLEGAIIAVQSLLEMRRSAQRWLGDLAGSVPPEIAPRLSQAAEFTRRVVAALRPVAEHFQPPADRLKQVKPDRLRNAADALYEVRRTEETLTRLLRGIAGDLGVYP